MRGSVLGDQANHIFVNNILYFVQYLPSATIDKLVDRDRESLESELVQPDLRSHLCLLKQFRQCSIDSDTMSRSLNNREFFTDSATEFAKTQAVFRAEQSGDEQSALSKLCHSSTCEPLCRRSIHLIINIKKVNV